MGSSERQSRRFYDRYAPFYDWVEPFVALLRGVSDTKERRKAVGPLNLKSGQRVLEVSVGTGSNLPLMAERVGPTGSLVGLDISRGMLARCRRKLRRRGLRASLIEGEAGHLPFADRAFDAVFHHGGLAEFGDRKGAIEEMIRVAVPGARIVICDPGVPTDRPLSLKNRLFLKIQRVHYMEPPLDLLPSDVLDSRLTWLRGGGWYMLQFTKPPGAPPA